jgi:hypothetical protein
MPSPTFQALVGDLRTGKITNRIPITGCTWQQVINSAGNLTNIGINAAAAELAGTDLYHTTAPAKTFFALQFDQGLLNAGPIWTRGFNMKSARLTLGAAGLWSLFDHRLIMPLLAEPLALGAAQAAVTTYPTSANMSLGDIAAGLASQALTHVGGNLPLVMPPAQGRTPGETRTFNGYDLPAVGPKIYELTQVNNGPEVRFPARFKAGDPTSIEWVMQVGTPAAPNLVQSGADWVFDASVPKSMVSDIDFSEDVTTMATRAWVTGAGSQTGLLLSQADSTTLTSVGYPLLEVVDNSHNNASIQATLDGYAAQILVTQGRPATVWKITVRNDGAPLEGNPSGPRLGQYQAGDYCVVILGPNPFLPAGPRRARILQIDGTLAFECVLTIATLIPEI